MLRVSATVTETAIDINMINGERKEDISNLEYGEELMKFAETLATRNETDLAEARVRLLNIAGQQVLVDAAGVAANFQRMVRIADAMGIPVDTKDSELSNKIRQDLDLYRFSSAENSA
jgi:hypothetical protein